MRVAEKVTRNIGILRRELTGEYSCPGHHSPQVPVTSRAYWAALITDEEKANVEYRQLADKMAPGGPLEVATWVREIVWDIAEDEARHAEKLQEILKGLVEIRKIV